MPKDSQTLWLHVLYTSQDTELFFSYSSSKEDRRHVSLHSKDSHQTHRHPHPHPSFHENPRGSSEWYSTGPVYGQHHGFSSSFPRGRVGIPTHPKPSEGASKTIFHRY